MSSSGPGSSPPEPPAGLGAALAEIMQRLEDLGDKLALVTGRLQEVSASSRGTRRLAVGLAASFALDIALTLVLGFTAFSAHDTASANAQLVGELHAQQLALHASQLASCANGNTFRADQDVIWQDFIGLVARPAPGETAAQAAKTGKLAAQFLAYVATVNHPIDCAALYGK